MMIDQLSQYNVLGLYDLAEISKSPDRIYQILNTHKLDEFSNLHRIVFYTQYTPSKELLSHIQQAAILIDVDNCFILICCPYDIRSIITDVCKPNNNIDSLKVNIHKSCQLENSFSLPSTFCPVPWQSIEVRANGKVFPCCVNTKSVGNISSSLEHVFYNEEMSALRKAFISGDKPESCKNCWNNEERGLVTNRKRYISVNLKDVMLTGLDNPAIKQLDLKFGNTCNFKCRICHPSASSAFAKEDAKFRKIPFVVENNWAENPKHLSEIIELLPSITNIDMYGGEPFLLKLFSNVLKIASDKDYAKNIRLHYNSNGSRYPTELLQYWHNFREVDIHFSIDVLGPKFTLERGSTWEEIETNILKIKNLNLPNLKINIMPTVSIMNILYIDEVIAWANKHEFGINIQHVVNIPGFSLKNLTKDAKKLILNKLKDIDCPEIQNILLYIKSSPDNDGLEFIELTKHFDKLRNENFAETHPEIAKAMGYVYNQK